MPYIRHAKVSGAGPAADSSKVGGDDWDDDHVWVGGPEKATVTLSSADILDLHNTPVTLVAAPGAGKWLFVHKVHTALVYGTTAYVPADANPNIALSGGSSVVGDVAVIQETTTRGLTYNPTQNYTPADENAALVIGVGDAISDGDSPLTITVWYTIEDVP